MIFNMQMFHILKYSIILLLLYNILTVGILYFSNYKIKNIFWKFTPYEFNQLLYYPNHLRISPSSNKKDKDISIEILKKNINRNYLDIEYWNYKFFIENIDRDNKKELQNAFYKTLVLSKNNRKKKLNLTYYFTNNYSNFSSPYKVKIIKTIFSKD